MIENRDSPETILAAVQHTQQSRFANIHRVTSIVRLWQEFCIDELHTGNFLPTQEPPCYYDPDTGLWVLGKNAAAAFYRSRLLAAIELRDRNADTVAPTSNLNL